MVWCHLALQDDTTYIGYDVIRSSIWVRRRGSHYPLKSQGITEINTTSSQNAYGM